MTQPIEREDPIDALIREWMAKQQGGRGPVFRQGSRGTELWDDDAKRWVPVGGTTPVEPESRTPSFRPGSKGMEYWDPATGQWAPVPGVAPLPEPEREPTVYEAGAAERAGRAGEIEWVGYDPAYQWTTGGQRQSLTNVYSKVAALKQKIEELQEKKAQYTNYLAHPEWATGGERDVEMAALQQDVADIDRQLSGYTRQLTMIAKDQKLDLGGLIPGLTGGGAAGGAGGGGAGRTRFPEERALDEAQAGYYSAQTEKIKREQLGKAQLALDNYFKTIKELEGMMGRDEIKPAEASAIMALLKQDVDATIKGTTIFDEQKNLAQEKRQRAEIGKDLINQRVASSQNLASSLISGFGQNIKDIGWGLKPGEKMDFDPFQMAETFTNRMGGGAEMGELGRTLLSGLGESPMPGRPPSVGAGAMDPETGLPMDLVTKFRALEAQRGGLPGGQMD